MNTNAVKKTKRRTLFMVFLFVLWSSVIAFRLVDLQIINHKELNRQVQRQNQNQDDIIPLRGTIYDRNGNRLACSVPRASVFYSSVAEEPLETQFQRINQLKKILGISWKKVRNIKEQIKDDDPFIYVKRKIEPENEELLRSMDLKGVHMLEESKRFYPHGDLASHVIGRVDFSEKGISGVELEFNSLLRGEKGIMLNYKDARRKEYSFQILKQAEPGKDLILSIDETIQYIAAENLKRAVLDSKAAWGTIIVSSPRTGEILAMSSYPESDLNEPLTDVHMLFSNKAIHHVFDPGSTFKIVTFSAAIESNKIPYSETFDCSKGYIRVANKTFHDHHRYELLSFPEVIIHSSNVGTIQVGQLVGERLLYEKIKSFGFGKKTGIELPAEQVGILHPVDKWSRLSLPSLSIGYEISVTALQLLNALNVIANNGVQIPFTIIKKGEYPDSIPTKENPIPHRVIEEKTALQLKDMLKKVVNEGTGRSAQIKAYQAAGKTGTAQKIDSQTGRYTSGAHTSIFMGFVPAGDPALSMIIVIDDPKGLYYGGQVSAPVFKETAVKALRYLGIPPKAEYVQPIITAQNVNKGKT
ncbi:MAG: peptidoglycan D,D-transpeptidase FtsI family protein [Acidobacteriota bacterium]